MGVSAGTRTDLYYSARMSGPPQGHVFVPGRVVLLGEHVDHQGGSILAVPTTQGIHVAWGVRPDHRVALHALNARSKDKFDQGAIARSGRRWADLARGACARLGENRRLPGVNLVVFGDLPTRVGLASSAAYTSAILTAVLQAIGEDADPATVAQHAAAIEHEWAGVACGFMDPYVVMAGRPNEVVHLDNRTLTHERLPLPEGTSLTHADTGVQRRLSETPYNERRRELAAALQEIRSREPDLQSLVDLTPERFAALEEGVAEPGRRRARHVVTEIERVKQGADALRRGDAEAVGVLMQSCHESLARDFECSTEAIDEQVARLREEDGVLGVRLQGAGWGGSLAVLRRAD